jgi:hypothetical protein
MSYSSEVVVERKDGKVLVRTPYEPKFIEELKRVSKTRQWSAPDRAWVIDEKELDVVVKLLEKYFPKVEEYVRLNDVPFMKGVSLIEVPITDSIHQAIESLGLESPSTKDGKWVVRVEKPEYIEYLMKKVLELKSLEHDKSRIYIVKLDLTEGGLSRLVSYGRDAAYISNNALFNGLYFIRAELLRGSAKHPRFHGFVVISSKFRPDLICRKAKEYIELPDTPEVREKVYKILNELRPKLANATNQDEVLSVWEELKKRVEELKKGLVEVRPILTTTPAVSEGLKKMYVTIIKLPPHGFDWLRSLVRELASEKFSVISDLVLITTSEEVLDEVAKIEKVIREKIMSALGRSDVERLYSVKTITTYVEPKHLKELTPTEEVTKEVKKKVLITA